MNKIFRVVWNQATQSWVAVSELTKAHKKQSSSNSLKAVVGTAAVLLSINTAQAAVGLVRQMLTPLLKVRLRQRASMR